jgi:hypothetical protein
MNNTIFWDLTGRTSVVHRRFGGNTASIFWIEEYLQQEAGPCLVVHLFDLLFSRKDGGSMLLLNFDELLLVDLILFTIFTYLMSHYQD